MTDDEKLAIVNRLYERSAVGDFDTCETLLTDDFFIVEADDTPMAGTFTGITALRDLYAQVFGMLEVTLNRSFLYVTEPTTIFRRQIGNSRTDRPVWPPD